MDHINKTLEAAHNALVTNSTESHERILKRTDIPAHWVSALFKRFQARYLHKWTSAIEGIESIAVAEWSQKLNGLSGEQIKNGLDNWSNDWPPCADEFRDACLGRKVGLNEYGLDYVPEIYRVQSIEDVPRLEKKRDKEKAKAAIREMMENGYVYSKR